MRSVIALGMAALAPELVWAATSPEAGGPPPGRIAAKSNISAQADQESAIRHEAKVHGLVVDEAGNPVPEVEVRAIQVEGRHSSGVSDPNGQFDFILHGGRLDGTFLRAAVTDGGRQGIYQYAYLLTEAQRKQPARIVLRPAHPLTICVVDRGGKPIADAAVGFIANDNPISGGRTDAGGRWAVRVPADWYQWCAFAFKSNFGFDYAGARKRQSGEGTVMRQLPNQLTLTLDGARTERVKAVDRYGKPIDGVRVAPYTLQKIGHEPFENWLDRTWQLWPATGNDGVITLDWLPRRFGESMSLGEYADGLHEVGPLWIMADAPSKLVTVTFLPMEFISGRVTHADGRPAVDVLVAAEGHGSGTTSVPAPARTDAEGRYEIRAESEQAYILVVNDKEWAAPYRGAIVLRAGKPDGGVDFVLRRATRLRGRVTAGKEGRPVPNTTIRLVIDKGEIPAEIQIGVKRAHDHVRKTAFAETDEAGHYEFRLGPGEYQLEGLGRSGPLKLKVPEENTPLEITRDIRIPVP